MASFVKNALIKHFHTICPKESKKVSQKIFQEESNKVVLTKKTYEYLLDMNKKQMKLTKSQTSLFEKASFNVNENNLFTVLFRWRALVMKSKDDKKGEKAIKKEEKSRDDEKEGKAIKKEEKSRDDEDVEKGDLQMTILLASRDVTISEFLKSLGKGDARADYLTGAADKKCTIHVDPDYNLEMELKEGW